MGRNTKLTPDLLERVVTLVRSGCYIETAAGAAGIARSNLYEWLRKGGEGIKPYVDFYEQVTQARDQAEARDVANVGKAAQSDWRAAAWRLEKMHGRRYAGVSVNETKVEHIDRAAQAKSVHEAYGFSKEPEDIGDGEPGSVPEKIHH